MAWSSLDQSSPSQRLPLMGVEQWLFTPTLIRTTYIRSPSACSLQSPPSGIYKFQFRFECFLLSCLSPLFSQFLYCSTLLITVAAPQPDILHCPVYSVVCYKQASSHYLKTFLSASHFTLADYTDRAPVPWLLSLTVWSAWVH